MFNFDEYAELFENYVHNKDLISKTFGKDLRIVGWIAKGLGLFFQEKSPKEMFEYMKNPDLRLLLKE